MRAKSAIYLLLAPAAVIFCTLFVLPLIYFFVISFWRVLLFKLKPDFIFTNYSQVFELHLPTLVFTLGLALLVAALTTSLGFVYAYLVRFKAGNWGPLLLFVALITLFGGNLNMIGVQIAPQFGGLGNWPMGAAMSFVTLGSSLAVILLSLALLAQWRPR